MAEKYEIGLFVTSDLGPAELLAEAGSFEDADEGQCSVEYLDTGEGSSHQFLVRIVVDTDKDPAELLGSALTSDRFGSVDEDQTYVESWEPEPTEPHVVYLAVWSDGKRSFIPSDDLEATLEKLRPPEGVYLVRMMPIPLGRNKGITFA